MLSLSDLGDYSSDYDSYDEGDYDNYLDDDYEGDDSDLATPPTPAPGVPVTVDRQSDGFDPSPRIPEVTTNLPVETPKESYGIPLGEPVAFK